MHKVNAITQEEGQKLTKQPPCLAVAKVSLAVITGAASCLLQQRLSTRTTLSSRSRDSTGKELLLSHFADSKSEA